MKEFQVDYSDLLDLEQDLVDAERDLVPEVKKVVSKGALNIRVQSRELISGHAHSPNYPFTITYDMKTTGTEVSAEIGPDKDKRVGGGPHQTPGNLGAILEHGTPHSAPIPHMAPAGDAEAPRFEKALADLGERLAPR